MCWPGSLHGRRGSHPPVLPGSPPLCRCPTSSQPVRSGEHLFPTLSIQMMSTLVHTSLPAFASASWRQVPGSGLPGERNICQVLPHSVSQPLYPHVTGGHVPSAPVVFGCTSVEDLGSEGLAVRSVRRARSAQWLEPAETVQCTHRSPDGGPGGRTGSMGPRNLQLLRVEKPRGLPPSTRPNFSKPSSGFLSRTPQRGIKHSGSEKVKQKLFRHPWGAGKTPGGLRSSPTCH